jgi:hypothetical protein
MGKQITAKSNKRDRAAQVLPLSELTVATLEARLYLEQNVPPAGPKDFTDPEMVAGLVYETVIRPLVQSLAFLEMSTDHRIVVRHAPWIEESPPLPVKPAGTRALFRKHAGLLVGCLLFRYLAALTDQSTYAHRSYRGAAAGQCVVVDVDMAIPAIQIYLPEPVALAIGHAVASHFILGKAVV